MRSIYGKLEALILLSCGVTILCFSFSESYSLLMNPRFKWLTVTGAALLVLMGLTALSSSARRSGMNTWVFAVLLMLVVLGRPHLPDAEGSPGMEPEPDAGLLEGMDLEQFPRAEFQYLFKDARSRADAGEGFTIVGTAKRLDVLDRHGSFAVMTSVMYCCLADIFAAGYRVVHEDWAEIEDGQPLLISGNFVPESRDLTVPNFKFGRSMFSTVDKEFIIQPDRIVSYNRLDELPRITELLGGKNAARFAGYLKKAGLWDQLEQEGPFTVFVPVDQAIEALEDGFENRSPEGLKDALSLHVVPGRLFISDLMELDSVESINGTELKIDLKNGRLTVEGCRFLFKDSEAGNGVVHYIYPAILKEGSGNE